MNIIIAHGFAHRILSTGTLESCPVDPEVLCPDGEWKMRGEIEMDLTGGDVEFIRNTLQQLSYVFASSERRNAHMVPLMPTVVGGDERPL